MDVWMPFDLLLDNTGRTHFLVRASDKVTALCTVLCNCVKANEGKTQKTVYLRHCYHDA